MGSLVMVGVGPLQPLACVIFPGGLPWAGKLSMSTGRSCKQLILLCSKLLLDWISCINFASQNKAFCDRFSSTLRHSAHTCAYQTT